MESALVPVDSANATANASGSKGTPTIVEPAIKSAALDAFVTWVDAVLLAHQECSFVKKIVAFASTWKPTTKTAEPVGRLAPKDNSAKQGNADAPKDFCFVTEVASMSATTTSTVAVVENSVYKADNVCKEAAETVLLESSVETNAALRTLLAYKETALTQIQTPKTAAR